MRCVGRISDARLMSNLTEAVVRAGDVCSLVDLIAPTRCLGCGCPGRRLCDDCVAKVETRPEPRIVVDAAGPLEVWMGAGYVGVVRSAILDFKRGGARMVGSVLAQWGARALAVWRCSSEQPPMQVIPIHSGSQTRRRAGLDVSAFLARAGCRELSPQGYGPVVVDRLRLPRPAVTSQKALFGAERFRNVRGTMRARVGDVGSGDFVLFDDVVTTGASMLEARRALAAVGIRVRGAACVAAVATPDSRRDAARDPPNGASFPPQR